MEARHCDICGVWKVQDDYDWKLHYKRHEEKKNVICSVCREIFSNDAEYTQHFSSRGHIQKARKYQYGPSEICKYNDILEFEYFQPDEVKAFTKCPEAKKCINCPMINDTIKSVSIFGHKYTVKGKYGISIYIYY
jgi:hypothetical protein